MSPKRLGKGRVQDKAFRPTTPPLGPKPSEDTILDSIPDDFRYTPLLPEDQHIRVLDVLPRISGRPLECEMRTVPLSDSASSYETVSYCWGDPTPSKVLAVNGAKLRVPTSSWNALNRLAYEDRPRTLWIDAVCINQHDKSERAQQVSLMAKVYSRGQRNVVYLGEHDDEVLVDAAFSTVRTMHSELSQDVVYQRALQRFRNGDLFVPHSQVPIQCDWDHKPLVTLFSSEWFSRLWVVQETCLATSNHCVWGGQAVDFETILEVATWLGVYHAFHIPIQLEACSGLRNAHYVNMTRTLFHLSGSLRLDDALYLGRGLDATDSRDKVYGILGLIKGRFRALAELEPDYSKSWQEVFSDAVRVCICDESFGSGILRFISHRDLADIHAEGLPSWVPRLQRPWDNEVDSSGFKYHPGKEERLGRARVGGSKGVLTLDGWVLDIVESVSDVAAFLELDYDMEAQWFAQVASMARNRLEIYEDALARTLITDTNWQKRVSTPEYRRGYDDLMEHYKNGWDRPGLDDFSSRDSQLVAEFWSAIDDSTRNCRFATTKHGHFVLAPKLTQPSDIVAIMPGFTSPLVLRPEGAHYLLLGECYVDGLATWQNGYDEFREKHKEDSITKFEIH